MKATLRRSGGFSLIELITVMAVLLILAGIIFVPLAGAVRRQAAVAASKAQLQQYVTAIQMFKSEYGFYPFADAQVVAGKNINALTDDFIETLSGRDGSGAVVQSGGNRRSIAFHTFGESEIGVDGSAGIRLIDRFENSQIFIAIDGDGDGKLSVPVPDGTGNKDVRVSVTAYALADSTTGAPAYFLYD